MHDVRVGDLELEHRLVHCGSGEAGDDRLDGTEEDVHGLELAGVSVGDEQDAPAGPRHADHLTQRPGLVRDQHHPDLRAHHMVGVVRQIERVTGHHLSLGGEAFGGCPGGEALDHLRRPVGGEHPRAETRGGQTEPARAGGDVEESMAGLNAGQP